MWKYLSKGISTPLAIGVILILAVIICSFTWWQYGKIQKEESNVLEMQVSEKKDETADWETYTNEEYGFELEYPKEWISVTFDSKINDEVYILKSSNENIEKVFYFKPQKMVSFVVKGEDYSSVCPEWNQGHIVVPHSEILKILYLNKEIKTIYTTKKPNNSDCFDIEYVGYVNLSPNGEYIEFTLDGWEWTFSSLININTGKDIGGAGFYNPYTQIFWSSSNKTLAIVSPPCDMEPCGTSGGIFVSDYNNPENLNNILYPSDRFKVKELYFVNDDKLFFTVIIEFDNKTTKYEYDIATKELKEIN